MTLSHSTKPDMAHLSPADIAEISRLLRERTGIKIMPAQSSMLQSRLGRRLRNLGLSTFADYLVFVGSQDGEEELKSMISALTTNVTHFFRESHHFDFLNETVLPQLLTRARHGDRIRFWSAGCSSGQEPYSIAMAIAMQAPDLHKLDVRILATDIDAPMIIQAKRALYRPEALEPIPQTLRNRFFSHRPDGYEFSAELRRIITFRELNLLDIWPMHGPFDVIFCRNVAIYFDSDAQERLWKRLENILAPGGWLFMGHSERMPTAGGTRLQSVGVTTYQAPSHQPSRSH